MSEVINMNKSWCVPCEEGCSASQFSARLASTSIHQAGITEDYLRTISQAEASGGSEWESDTESRQFSTSLPGRTAGKRRWLESLVGNGKLSKAFLILAVRKTQNVEGWRNHTHL